MSVIIVVVVTTKIRASASLDLSSELQLEKAANPNKTVILHISDNVASARMTESGM
ncbi:MAG: hypothetical protein ACJ0K4_00235 [Verrucomicrobiales bacterium]